jgi:hypothetical protein
VRLAALAALALALVGEGGPTFENAVYGHPARAAEVDNRRSVSVLGRTLEGRAVRALRIGNPRSQRRVLVVGCVHGDECAGTAVTQRERRIARKLILRLRPDVSIWFHQPQSVVRARGPSRAAARRYAQLADVPYRSLQWPPGSASRWQTGLGQTSFVVELPPGELPDGLARRQAAAVLALPE